MTGDLCDAFQCIREGTGGPEIQPWLWASSGEKSRTVYHVVEDLVNPEGRKPVRKG